MTQKYCPRCNTRFTVSWGVTDFEHRCNSKSEVLDNEDILILGNWEDYTGSDNEVQRKQGPYPGIVNVLQGTRADVEGEEHEARTSRGVKKSIYRQRQHLEYVDNIQPK